MSSHFHALVWIDHREAKVFQFNATDVDRHGAAVSTRTSIFITRQTPATVAMRPPDKEFYKHVAQAIAHAGAILIAGPSSAKTELVTYIKHDSPSWRRRSRASKHSIITDRWRAARARSQVFQGR